MEGLGWAGVSLAWVVAARAGPEASLRHWAGSQSCESSLSSLVPCLGGLRCLGWVWVVG